MHQLMNISQLKPRTCTPLGLVAYNLPNLIITSYIADFIAANANLAALNYHTLMRRVEIRGASQRNVTIVVLCLDFRGGNSICTIQVHFPCFQLMFRRP